MARPKKTAPKKPAKQKISLDMAAESAADDELMDIDPDLSDFEVDELTAGPLAQEDPEDYSESPAFTKDVFMDSQNKAKMLSDWAKYTIKRGNDLLGNQDFPYSWERLQKDYGPGYYTVQGRCKNSGKILSQQTQSIGDPRTIAELQREQNNDHHEETHEKPDPMAWITLMNQQQEKAEAKAQQAATSQTNAMAMMMQTMMTMQQQSTQQFQTMLLEMNKQSQSQAQSQMTLLTTLLTAGPKDKSMDPMLMIKMMQDSEKRGEDKSKEMYRLIEDKVEKLAEEKAELMSANAGEGEESMIKTVIKGFVPILSQALSQGGLGGMGQTPNNIDRANQFTPEQVALIEKQKEEALKKSNQMIEAQRVAAQTPVPANFAGKTVNNTEVRPVNKSTVTNTQAVTKVDGGIRRGEVVMKEKIFNLVAGDIGSALLLRKGASQTAEGVIKKLESSGITRQTVLDNVSLEDVFAFAADNGVPLEKAKPWLTEFYEFIQTNKTANGLPARAGAQSRQPSQNI